MELQINTDRLTLREIEFTDLETLHALNSIPEVDEYNTLGIPESVEVTKQLLIELLNAKRDMPKIKYTLVIENEGKDFIGLVGLIVGRPKYKNAEVWFKLHPDYWNKGYATETVKKVLHFAFTELNLHRLEAGCAVENKASARVLEKCGFIKEGQCRKKLPIRGEWKDNFEFAILDTDFIK